MPVSPARAAAFEILLRVDREESYAAELLHSTPLAKLSSRDHGLATELVMGVLRWQSLLDERLAAASSQKNRATRRGGSGRIAPRRVSSAVSLWVPARAAIFESVELVKAARKRSAASFVNAVLRKIAGASRRRCLHANRQCARRDDARPERCSSRVAGDALGRAIWTGDCAADLRS